MHKPTVQRLPIRQQTRVVLRRTRHPVERHTRAHGHTGEVQWDCRTQTHRHTPPSCSTIQPTQRKHTHTWYSLHCDTQTHPRWNTRNQPSNARKSHMSMPAIRAIYRPQKHSRYFNQINNTHTEPHNRFPAGSFHGLYGILYGKIRIPRLNNQQGNKRKTHEDFSLFRVLMCL